MGSLAEASEGTEKITGSPIPLLHSANGDFTCPQK